MANNYIINNSRFTPYTFQEMIAPLNMYKEEYEKREKALDELDIDIAGIKLTEADSPYLQMYNTYKEDYKTALDGLYNNGLSGASREELGKLKRRFKTDIKGLKEKVDLRNALIQKQAEESRANPYLLHSNDYSKIALDDINAGSTYTSFDISTAINNAASQMDLLAKQNVYKGTPVDVGNGVLRVKKGYGFDESQFNNDIDNPNTEIGALYNSLLSTVPEEFRDTEVVKNSIKAGMKAKMGVFDYQYMNNPSVHNNNNIITTKEGEKFIKAGDHFYNIDTGEWITNPGKDSTPSTIGTLISRTTIPAGTDNRFPIDQYPQDVIVEKYQKGSITTTIFKDNNGNVISGGYSESSSGNTGNITIDGTTYLVKKVGNKWFYTDSTGKIDKEVPVEQTRWIKEFYYDENGNKVYFMGTDNTKTESSIIPQSQPSGPYNFGNRGYDQNKEDNKWGGR